MINRSISRIRLFILAILISISAGILKATSLTPKEEKGLWGYVDEKGKWRIKPKFHSAGEFNDGLASVMNYYNHNASIVELYGYINQSGAFVIPQRYGYASDFSNGLAVVGELKGTSSIRQHQWSIKGLKNDLIEMQIINTEGKSTNISDSPNFIDISKSDSITLYRICLNSILVERIATSEVKHLLKNENKAYKPIYSNKIIFDVNKLPEIDDDDSTESIRKDNLNRLPGFRDDYWLPTLINKLIYINSIDIDLFSWGENKRSIIYDKTNKALPNITYSIYSPKSKTQIVAADTLGMWGFKNTSNEWVIPAKYDFVDYYNGCVSSDANPKIKNLFRTHSEEGWGLIDSIGNIIAESQYEEINMLYSYKYDSIEKRYFRCQNGAFSVKKNNLWGIVDPKGQILIQPKFDIIEVLSYDAYYDSIPYYLSHKGDKTGVINSYFKELFPPRDGYNFKYNRKYNLVQYSLNGSTVLCDTLGNHIFSAKNIERISNPDRFIFKNDNLWGVVNRDGDIFIPDTCQMISDCCQYYVISNKLYGEDVINLKGQKIFYNPLYKVNRHASLGLCILEVQEMKDPPVLTYYKITGEQLKYADGKPIIGLIDNKCRHYVIGEYNSILTPTGYVFLHKESGDVYNNRCYYQIISSKWPDPNIMALFYNERGETMMDIINCETSEIINSGYYDGRQ